MSLDFDDGAVVVSSSDDGGDSCEDHHNLVAIKKIRHAISKRESSDAPYSESGSEKETGGASRDSDSSASGTCYVLPSPKRKTPTKANNETYEEDNESFLQDDSCSRLSKTSSRLSKCRECYKCPDTNQYSCRFYSFRKLRLSKNRIKVNAGFARPSDASPDEVKLWLPDLSGSSSNNSCSDVKRDQLDFHVARFILLQVGDQFCDLMRQEEDAINLHMGEDKNPSWKKPMQGVREMCDVCKTTLFNFHWACGKCGFVVCIDCYKVRKNGKEKAWMVVGVDHDEWKWLYCTNRMPHEQASLMLCQTIAKDAHLKLGQLVHDVRDMFGIPQACQCERSSNTKSIPGVNMETLKELTKFDPLDAIINYLENEPGKSNDSKEHEARVVEEASKQQLPDDLFSYLQEDSSSDSEVDVEDKESLRDLLFPTNSSNCGSNNGSTINHCDFVGFDGQTPQYSSNLPSTSAQLLHPSDKNLPAMKPTISMEEKSNNVVSCIDDVHESENKKTIQHFTRRHHSSARVNRMQLPARIMTKAQSEDMYPGVPHSWLCEGMLLRLIDPSHSGNYRLFQDQWRRGQPVIVGNMTKLLNMQRWHPDSFCEDFGDKKNDLINCATGNLVPNRPMREFWEGFENFSKRLKDEKGNPMLLKLKDWPPGDDFAELLPDRFEDLMQALPLAEYTRRTGRLNLASCLPEFFVRPDLGPKMYNAYGSALFPTKGTTNLHLDISDAVNFMVYVGIPVDSNSDEHIQEALNAIDEAGCDEITRRRVRLKGEMPGALWHIYHACDADKIRDLLNKVAIEKGTRLEPHHDPIHDQSSYLDGVLRERLYQEYGVKGYAIVQCLGDAVFIPAGAPHQVRNLHNCVKVAEDFVSPENVSQCFHLTQEFRDLTESHSNHEDKLQIKNIIYHTIKESISSLLRVVTNNCDGICNGDKTL